MNEWMNKQANNNNKGGKILILDGTICWMVVKWFLFVIDSSTALVSTCKRSRSDRHQLPRKEKKEKKKSIKFRVVGWIHSGRMSRQKNRRGTVADWTKLGISVGFRFRRRNVVLLSQVNKSHHHHNPPPPLYPSPSSQLPSAIDDTSAAAGFRSPCGWLVHSL